MALERRRGRRVAANLFVAVSACLSVAALDACLLTSSLDRVSRDYGKEDPGDAGSTSSEAPADAGAEAVPDADAGFCAGQRGPFLFCDDFDRSTDLASN